MVKYSAVHARQHHGIPRGRSADASNEAVTKFRNWNDVFIVFPGSLLACFLLLPLILYWRVVSPLLLLKFLDILASPLPSTKLAISLTASVGGGDCIVYILTTHQHL